MNLRKITILSILGASLFFVFWAALSSPQYGSIYAFKNFLTPEDSTTRTKSRRPTYQTEDRLGDQYNNKTNKSPLELQNPDNITEEVEIDTATGNYIVREKIGDMEYRTQTYLTFEEYYNYKNKQMLRDYWQHKDTTATPQRGAKPGQPFGFTKHVKGLEGPFGSNYVDIRPSGLVTLDFAGRWQRVNNPSLPIKQQRTGLFDFDQQISMNVIGKVGEKLKLTVNWDTKAAFEFQNSVKIQYTAFEEDIIQAIEVGRVNMPLNSSLMTGPQNLFGLKTKLQFGRLSVTAVAARQDGKLDEIKIGGGGQGRTFEIKADGYEPYRHFFLSQFFRANYEKSLKSSPTVLSGVQVKRVDVYITNRNNTTANLRSVVGYLDLGESDSIYRDGLANPPPFGPKVPYNEINKLYNGPHPVTDYRDAQNLDANLKVIAQDCGCEFQDGTDYTYLKSARKLLPTEFTFNPDLGYITLQTRLNEDEALLVAYQYTYNNEQYTVGEFQDDLTDIESTDLIIAKMIKPPVIKTHLPTWDLMMKNIYQLGVTQLQRDNFQFRIIYKDDATGLDIPNLQEGANTKNVPLLRLCGLDYLNPNNDPAPDGNFDYVEGVTVDSRNGRIMFPVLEPFGSNLESKFLPSETAYKQKYVFSELYDSTASDASQIASKNKYFFQGRYTAGTASEIMLPGINVAQGSVVVVAGSITLVEGKDYTVDYSLGRIKILNESVLASGQEIRIRFEKQDLFNFRRKSFLGTRLDYKVNDKILLGATMLHSNEAPNITRVNIGDEPAANTIWGLDASVKSTSRMLTRAVDFLPVVSTKAPSNISFQGEFAQFLPGYNKILDKNGSGEGGIAFIDDFEGAKTPYDLTRSPLTWTMAATPQRMQPDADSTGLPNGYRRARLAWYNIDNIFYRSNNGLPAYLDYSKITNHFERNITQLELFPNQDLNVAVTNIPTLDLAFYPAERGAYNFTDNMNPDGTLKNPTSNWGGITKAIKNNIDFDNANIQYIEFWLLSPFIDGANGHTKIDGVPFDQTNTGYLYFNLGSISEDVLPDNLQSYENGLPTDGSNTGTTPTTWGRVSTKQYITNAFDNDPASRPYQDVGLDGLGDTSELNKFANRALAIESVVTPAAYAGIKNDLCADNFQYYLGSAQDIDELTILQRYKHFNLTQNNSPINNGASITPSSSNYPDNEDLNQDNNLNTLEEYYEYKIKIDKNEFQIGKNYIVSSRELTITASDGSGDDVVTWYQFRVPIRTPDSIVGNIQGFKSIKWMRTYVTGFKSPVVLRMAQFQLVANQWRPYNLPDLQGPNLQNRTDESVIDLSVVNVEENSTSNGGTTPYVLPPDFNRDYDATSVTTRRTNEQSLRLCIDGLQDGSTRAAYKNVNLNLMNYKKVEMFIHAESEAPPKDCMAFALFRLGTDYTNNYYEVQVPLHFTTPITSTDPHEVWRSENAISVNITDLVNAKLARNNSGASQQASYRIGPTANGQYIVVVGNPDLSAVVTLMIGLKNPIGGDANPMKFCIWTDELRASGFSSHSSIAYAANLSANLADLGTVNGSIRYTSAGFGSLDQKVSQRERANTLEYGLNTQLAMEKFIPGKTGLKVPLYLGYNRKVISPQYDPLNPDVTVAESVNAQGDPKTYRDLIIDQQATKAINLAGLQKTKVNPASKKHIYDVENLMLTLGYTQTTRSSYDIKKMEYEKYNGTFAYNFSNAAKSYTPLKSMKQTKGIFTPLFKDFNFALMPSQIGFKADLDRELRTTQYYQSNPKEGLVQDPIYAKSFTFKRNYSFLWNLTKSATLTYRADAGALIDEPNRAPGGQEYKDSIMSNLLRMGRLKTFDQTYTLNYKVPLDKVKMLNWTSMDYTYGAGYTWTAGALGLRDSLGNTIKNKQDNTLNAKIDLDKLYSKSKFLMEMKKPKPPLKKPDPKDTIPPPPNRTLLKAAFKTLMMIRNANLAYTNSQYTSMGGFMETPKYLGFSSNQNMGIMAPFILGSQNADFRTDAAAVGWISTASSINSLFTQSTTQNLTGRMNVEPIKDFKIVLEAKYSKTNLYEERFRSIDGTINGFVSGNPTLKGNYSISTITILTAFDKHISGSKDPNSSANFEKFTEYRAIMDARLGGKSTDYTETSQSVLFPAFLAAYAGLDPNKVNISGIPRIPLPGWQIDYTGLARSKALAKKFQSITIQHKYSSQYAVGSFASQTIYTSQFVTPTSNFYDTGLIPTETNASGQIVPIYIMTGVMVTESFAPFIGINARTKNKITYRVTYNRTRILNMSMSNAQLTESFNNSWQVGIGFARSNVKIPKFLTGGTQKFLKNELNIQVNFNINDMITYQRKFLDNATVTSGNTNIQFKPTVSYNMSQRVTMMLYFERTINSPKISSSYRRATTSIGVQVRFTLS